MTSTKAGPPASFLLVVDWIDVDWWIPLVACTVVGSVEAGVGFAVVALGLGLWSARTVTVGVENGGLYYSLTKVWQREGSTNRTVIADAVVHHWSGWFSRGIELRGPGFSLVASTRGSRRLKIPKEIQATEVPPPPVRFSYRPLLFNLVNILLLSASLLAVRGVGSWASAFVLFFGPFRIVSSLASSLRGAPTLTVFPDEDKSGKGDPKA